MVQIKAEVVGRRVAWGRPEPIGVRSVCIDGEEQPFACRVTMEERITLEGAPQTEIQIGNRHFVSNELPISNYFNVESTYEEHGAIWEIGSSEVILYAEETTYDR